MCGTLCNLVPEPFGHPSAVDQWTNVINPSITTDGISPPTSTPHEDDLQVSDGYQEISSIEPAGADRVPLCSVCIANFNGAEMLEDCLTSVFQQNGDMPIEVIVHDDASTDGSLALLTSKYPQVLVLASKRNVGFCVSNNRMVARARGAFVLLLNNDAALYPDALLTLVSLAGQHDRSDIFSLAQYDWSTGTLVDRGCFLDPFYNPVPNLDPAVSRVAMAIGACLFLRRALWNELGGFPEWMGSVGEDLFMCSTARLRGGSIVVASGSGYRHRQGASFGGNRIAENRLSTTYRRRKLSETNKIAVMIISTPCSVVWVLFPLHICALIVEGITLAIVKRDMYAWASIYWATLRIALTNFRRNLIHRRKEQKHRKVSLMIYFSTFTWKPRKLAMLGRYGFPKLR